MRTRRRVIAAKIESVEGIAESLSASDTGVLVIDPKVDVDIAMHERNPARASLGSLASLPGSQKASISFSVEVKGAGAAYSAFVKPALGVYLRACGFAETIDTALGAEKATYDPASDGIPSLTINSYEDGVIKSIIGARGNVKVVANMDEAVRLEFEFTGVWNELTDGAMLTPVDEETVPPVFLSANFSIESYAAIMTSIDIDMGNVVHLRQDANSPTGYRSAIITSRKATGSFNPEMTTVLEMDWYGRWKAGTPGVLNVGDIGDTQYNKFQITAPKIMATKVSDDDNGGQVVAGHTFDAGEDTGDDEIKIEFS